LSNTEFVFIDCQSNLQHSCRYVMVSCSRHKWVSDLLVHKLSTRRNTFLNQSSPLEIPTDSVYSEVIKSKSEIDWASEISYWSHLNTSSYVHR
jgi:hypothetical protein